ncbi:phosphatidate cytidylyltransferase, partial [Candidatus Dependentiae bacterium]|nr:phosphatidate cytidylyltransferase [Candidatus Dependentiae bacterium]
MQDFYQRTLTGAFLTVLVAITLFCMPPWAFATLMAIFLGIILTTEWPRLLNYKEPLFWLLMPVYPILPFMLVIILQLSGYQALNILMIAVIALFDTCSYIIGSLWGTHKISASISPGKTWEGYLGGTFITTLTVCTYFYKHND